MPEASSSPADSQRPSRPPRPVRAKGRSTTPTWTASRRALPAGELLPANSVLTSHASVPEPPPVPIRTGRGSRRVWWPCSSAARNAASAGVSPALHCALGANPCSSGRGWTVAKPAPKAPTRELPAQAGVDRRNRGRAFEPVRASPAGGGGPLCGHPDVLDLQSFPRLMMVLNMILESFPRRRGGPSAHGSGCLHGRSFPRRRGWTFGLRGPGANTPELHAQAGVNRT